MYSYVFLIALFVIGIYAVFVLPTKWLKVEHIHHKLGIGKTILQISDLHMDMLRISSAKLQKVIAVYKPDYIIITGDFTSNSNYLHSLNDYLKELAKSKVPLYAVLGNHDYRLPSLDALIKVLQGNNVHLLRNQSLDLGRFYLVGIDDYCTGHSDIEKAFSNITKAAKPVVIMTHDPNIVLEIKHSYDYLVAGHLHGKQANIPFLFKLKQKGKLSELGIYKGLHRAENGVFYISKGIGQAGINARVGVRSEVTSHEL